MSQFITIFVKIVKHKTPSIMKKHLLLILCTLFISASLNAQSNSSQHLTFLGIPINGPIATFQKKLIAKGFKYDQDNSRAFEEPIRFFNGKYAGEDALLIVQYIRNPNLVYSVCVTISKSTESEVINLYNHFKSNLEEKYNTEAIYYEDKAFLIVGNGIIRIFYSETTDDTYTLYINYHDAINTDKANENE